MRYETNTRLQRNFQSAINLVISDSVKFNNTDSMSLDLFSDEKDSVFIKKEYWGVFNLAMVKAYSKGRSITKRFLYGSELRDTLNACLYLADHQRPLQISGSTTLNGNVFLPKSGIKAGVIDGKSYEGKELVKGIIFKSDTSLTSLNQSLLMHAYELLQLCLDKNFRNSHSIALDDTLVHSFENPTRYCFINTVNKLRSRKIKGRVILMSDSLIQIRADVQLEDAIVVAPEIYVDPGFSGSVQLIAGKKITIGKNCTLRYPSAVILLKDAADNHQGLIEVSDSSLITGLIFAHSAESDRFKNQVHLNKGSKIEGVVYVHGFLQTAGSVYGTVLADFFTHKSILATYENCLVDVIIDRSKLSSHFVSPTLVKMPGRLNIVKWLN